MTTFDVSVQRERERVIQEFRAAEPIYKQLPLKVPRGGKISKFSCHCGYCGQEIDPDYFRGSFSVPFADGPALLTAHGYCAQCKAYTPFSQRVRGREGRLTSEYQNERGEWVWSPWAGSKTDMLRLSIKAWLAKFLPI